MNRFLKLLLLAISILFINQNVSATPGIIYKIYQFPQNKIPRIDGDFSDWDMVTDAYAIGLDQLKDTRFGRGTNLDPKDYNITVKVGWVKGLSRLYFYLEMEDDYWDFNDSALSQDIFELVVDADLSGGPFIKKTNNNKDKYPVNELHFKGHGAHAQNYHIFTPVQNKDWAMVWGNTPWIKDFPTANVAYEHNVKHGEGGKVQMEFWITAYDYAAIAGDQYSVKSTLKENDVIGMSWCVLEFDGKTCESFMNLAHNTKMIANADYLNTFKLMPLEKEHENVLSSNWSFRELSRNERKFQFFDQSEGDVTEWYWDFGDGIFSNEKNPQHSYSKAGEWTVILTVKDHKNNKSIRSKVWDVVTK